MPCCLVCVVIERGRGVVVWVGKIKLNLRENICSLISTKVKSNYKGEACWLEYSEVPSGKNLAHKISTTLAVRVQP